MSTLAILFFLAGPVIFAFGNLVLGPIFNKKIPMHIHFRSFLIGSVIYEILAYIGYYFFLKGQL